MRVLGWEDRLDRAVEAVRNRPYAIADNDCFRFACAVVEALTGVDHWPHWAGRYASLREALMLIAQHGRTFEAAFDWFFGTPRVAAAWAQRGDIVVMEQGGQKHLGVCLGAHAAFVGEAGLVFHPVLTCLGAWRI